MHACMHMHDTHACTHTHACCKHDKHGCLHGGGHFQFLYMYTCPCVCMHMCGDAPRHSHPPAPSSGRSRISPRWGCQLPGGCQHNILPKFPNNCMKWKEFGLPGGHTSKILLCSSATALPRAAGSPKHQNSISLKQIEIFRFCLKILYL